MQCFISSWILCKYVFIYVYIYIDMCVDMPWKSKTKQRMVLRMTHVKDSQGKFGLNGLPGSIYIYIQIFKYIHMLIHV